MSKKQSDTKSKALQAAIDQIQKKHGKESVIKLDSNPGPMPHIKTGSLYIDAALGIGGLPIGRIVEIYGPESSGKTTLALQVIRECQLAGGNAAFVDAEHALDPQYAKNLGVNLGDLLVSQPDSGEEALEITETLVNSQAVDLIVVDSVAALTPKAEIQGDMGDSHVGLQARMMSQAMRKLTSTVKKNQVMVVFINQIRMKIGVMFGSPETTTGGNALKFYASVRLDIRRIGQVKEGDQIIGNETRVKVVKNKVAPPFKQAEFQIIYNEGVSREGEILDAAVEHEMIKKAGAWYSHDGNKIGQGKNNAKAYLKENPDLTNQLELEIRRKILPEGVVEMEMKDMDTLIELAKKQNSEKEITGDE